MAARTLTCRRSDSLAPGASFPDVTLLVNVEPNASNLVNIVSVSGGGDATPGNNIDGDNTSINVSPDPTISLSRSTSLVVLDTAEYQAVVTNLGPGLLGGQTDVVAVFPTELVPLSGLGNGWQCATAGQRIRCSRIGPLLAGRGLLDDSVPRVGAPGSHVRSPWPRRWRTTPTAIPTTTSP